MQQNKKLKNRRSQAALEYLMTYGWSLMLLVVLIVLLTVNVQPVLIFGARCISTQGFLVQQTSINSMGIQTQVTNITNQKLNHAYFEVLDKDEVKIADINTTKWEKGESKVLEIPSNVGEGFFKIFIWASYPIAGITKTAAIECRGYAPEGQTNIIGYWRLDESSNDSRDSSVFGQHGSVIGNITRAQIGKNNFAYDFNGTGYVKVNYSDTLAKISKVTIMAWVKAKNNFLESQGILGMTENGGTGQYKGGYFLSTYWDGIQFGYKASENGWADWAECQQCLKQNVWQHVAGTYDGTHLKIYVDGVLKVNKAAALGFTLNQAHTAPLYIGQSPKWHWAINTQNFSGLIDDVRVYNKALTLSEIQSVYNSQK